MLSKFLDPKNDVAFKKIFGSEKHKDILIHFLNDMIQFDEGLPIQDVTFLKTVQDPDIAAKKTSMVDVLCRDEKGNTYIVEMQVARTKGFEKRAQYYAAKAYCSQMNAGESYTDLKQVIFLAITNFVMFPEKGAYKSDHVTLDRHTLENDLKAFSFTFVELPKFQKNIHDLESISDKWCYFFKHATETSEDDVEEIIGKDTIMKQAYKALSRFSWNEEELLTYEQDLKHERDYVSSMEQKFEEGVAKGMERGRAEGELKAKLEIAEALRQSGMSDAQIMALIALNPEGL
jgi:predicted transposase/invertase (TIGR01784 family)